jgi:hypothetical protein
MQNNAVQIGRVIRVGRGWADVKINGKMRRISTRSDLLIHAGTYLQIIDEQHVVILPASTRFAARGLL